MTDDENGQPFGPKANFADRRIRFCDDNLALLTTITASLGYAAGYFLFWRLASSCVQYVQGSPKA
jgi:hypothetical protein